MDVLLMQGVHCFSDKKFGSTLQKRVVSTN